MGKLVFKPPILTQELRILIVVWKHTVEYLTYKKLLVASPLLSMGNDSNTMDDWPLKNKGEMFQALQNFRYNHSPKGHGQEIPLFPRRIILNVALMYVRCVLCPHVKISHPPSCRNLSIEGDL